MSRPMAARTLLALCEDGGYRLHEAKRLTRRYICDVLQHDREERTGKLVQPEPAETPRRSQEEALLELFRVMRKLPAWLAEEKVRKRSTGRAAGRGKKAKRKRG